MHTLRVYILKRLLRSIPLVLFVERALVSVVIIWSFAG